jgi:hypothetical protein
MVLLGEKPGIYSQRALMFEIQIQCLYLSVSYESTQMGFTERNFILFSNLQEEKKLPGSARPLTTKFSPKKSTPTYRFESIPVKTQT